MVEQLLTDTAPVTRQAVEAENTAPVTHIASDRLYDSEMRLDAGHYNAATIEVNRLLGASGLSLKRMGDVTGRIFIPPRFKRIYVDYEHGVPFLQGTHLPQFKATDVRYLSHIAHKKVLPQYIIQPGWVLVTCSGTIGRVTMALRQWAGWAASQHILRIVPDPDSPCPPGYIYAWLTSPFGQAQFNGIYGAVVDEITAAHVSDMLIPVPETTEQQAIVNAINESAVKALEMKELALDTDAQSVELVAKLVTLT